MLIINVYHQNDSDIIEFEESSDSLMEGQTLDMTY